MFSFKTKVNSFLFFKTFTPPRVFPPSIGAGFGTGHRSDPRRVPESSLGLQAGLDHYLPLHARDRVRGSSADSRGVRGPSAHVPHARLSSLGVPVKERSVLGVVRAHF